jgi:hypothetical protein
MDVHASSETLKNEKIAISTDGITTLFVDTPDA